MTGTEQQKNKENVAAIMRAKQIAGKYEFVQGATELSGREFADMYACYSRNEEGRARTEMSCRTLVGCS